MKLILTVVLVALFLATILLDAVYRSIELKELKRRARGTRDTKSARLYRMSAYGRSLESFLLLTTSAIAAALIIMAANYAWWLALLAILAIIRLVWMARAPSRVSSLTWSMASYLAPPVTALVSLLHPLLALLPGLPKGASRARHTAVYEKDDLLEFINRQNQQADNRISEEDLQLVFGALTFGDKPVRAVMTPISQVKFVTADDTIGPHLMDELHQSGLPSFPVVKGGAKAADKEVVGTLYLEDVVNHPDGGKVRNIMKNDVYFINEEQTLREALAAFLKTHSHLLIVVNNFEETVGALTIEHVVEQIMGQKLGDEFERYDDPRAVAEIDSSGGEHQQSTAKVVE